MIVQVALGFSLYWISVGWKLREEQEDPAMPGRNAAGTPSFLAGQAMALVATTAVAGLLGLALGDWIKRERVVFAVYLLISIFLMLQAWWIHRDQPVHESHEPVRRLGFEEGRNLVLRHSLPLFLLFALFVSADSQVAVRRQLLGLFLGWATTNSLWGAKFGANGARLRLGLSLLSMATGALFLLKAWHKLF
jgi:putative Ca2+/H+ antiporter (TMEM165/GDT1 family)